MIKFSKNKKLNDVLNNIIIDYLEDTPEETLALFKQYYQAFNKKEVDYNLAQYGCGRVYYSELDNLYKNYKTLKIFDYDKLWEIYKRQTGYIVRYIMSLDNQTALDTLKKYY